MPIWSEIKNFFSTTETESFAQKHSQSDLHMAAAGLLALAAQMDGSVDEAERDAIVDILARHFEIEQGAARNLLSLGEEYAADSVDLHRFINVLGEHYPHEERVALIEMLWEVVLADGRLDSYEDNLLRRCAGLLHVSDRDSGLARQRVQEKHGA